MNEEHVSAGRGGAFTVEADVILHTVTSGMASPNKQHCDISPPTNGRHLTTANRGHHHDNKEVCHDDNQAFCQQSPPLPLQSLPLPITFQKEYLLDGGSLQNYHNNHRQSDKSFISETDPNNHKQTDKSLISETDHNNHRQTDKSFISKTDPFHISKDFPKQTQTSYVPEPSMGSYQNGSHGKNGVSGGDGGVNGDGNQVPYAVDSSLCVESHEEEEREESLSRNVVKGLCPPIGNIPSLLVKQSAVPDTHYVTVGTVPTSLELGLSFTPNSGTANSQYSSLTNQPTDHHNTQYGYPDNGNPGNNGDSMPPRKEPDLVIEVGGQKISAHKSILAEKSDYFKARLSRDILKVKGVNYKTLSVLIDYIYTARMNVSKDNVVDVITGAKILQVPCAVQAAMDSMSQQITPDNCYEILTIAKKQRLSELKETAYRFMSDNFLQILRDPAVYGRLTGSERDLILRKRTEGRKSLMAAEINDVFDRIGGSRPPSRCNSRPQSPLSVSSFEDSHMIYYFSETENDWRPLTVMPEDINTKGCGICTMYNYLFIAGGIRGYGDKSKASDKVFCYNPITGRWSEVRPLNQARSQLKLVSMDGNLYAIGGECLFTVERYDPRIDRWTTVAPLPKGAFAVAHEATTVNGELYVSGGSLFYRLLKYDVKRDEWQECPYNNSRKKSTDMVALRSFIYRFDVNREQGINVFKYNTIVKMWHDCASQRLGSLLPFRCAVIGNCIYCVNKQQTLQFIVEEENAYFVEEPLRAPLEAKGVLFPFVLSLPEKTEKAG